MLAGKMLEPVRGHAVAAHSVFTDAAHGGVTVLVTPPGRLLTEGLTRALLDAGRTPVWLRLGTEDRDPATLLLTMVAAVRRRAPGFGAELLQQAGMRPGPIFGWTGLYRALGDALAGSFPADAALVIEHADRVDPHSPALELACRHALLALPEHVPQILIGHADLPATRLLPSRRNSSLEPGVGPGRWLWRRRVTGMLRDSAAVRAALAFARTSLTEAETARAFRGSSPTEVLTLLAGAALSRADKGARRALARILHIGYATPGDRGAASGPLQGPWFQPLADGWWRIRTVWNGPLVAALGVDAQPDQDTLRALAVQLLRDGAAQTAIPILVSLGDQRALAEALRLVAAQMIGNGQWTTLGRWLDGLPAEIIDAEPALLDAAAHVTWSRGRADLARHWFDVAAMVGRPGRPPPPRAGMVAATAPEAAATAPEAAATAPGAATTSPAIIATAPAVAAAATSGAATTVGASRVALPDRPDLVVHVLGPLSAAVNGQPVSGWGSRQRSLLAYLVLHRAAAPPREVVMEALWPGADPAAARNNLQVAVHGLRRVFRAATSVGVVVFDRGVYRLAPELAVSVDLDAFEAHIRAGRALVDAGRPDEAITQWEAATALYRGDFLADGRTDDWAVPTREQLRLAHLDALDHLSVLYLDAGRHAMCALLCRQILERDPCREDAHRRLMRSHSRQGQPHLALLQYRTCAEVLARELRVAPAPATARLHEKVRRHEPI